MSVTQLLMYMDLPLVVRRCLVLPLLPIRCAWFVVWGRCFNRNVASIDEMTQHCVTDTQKNFVSHHITSHYITSHHTSHHFTRHHIASHITSHDIKSLHTTSHHFTQQHFTSQHFLRFVAKCVHRVTKAHFVITVESKLNIF